MAATDNYATVANAPFVRSLEEPYSNAAVVSPSDSVDLTNVTRAILVGTGGDIKVTMLGGQTVVLPGVPAGIQRLRVTRIWSTSTTASNLVAIW